MAECYFRHSSETREHTKAWDSLKEKVAEFGVHGHILIMGDFNAHTGIGEDITDAAGNILLRAADHMGLVILNHSSICKGTVIPKSGRYGEQPLYRDFVDKYQNAFAQWLLTASTLVAAGDDHQSTADSLERAFKPVSTMPLSKCSVASWLALPPAQ